MVKKGCQSRRSVVGIEDDNLFYFQQSTMIYTGNIRKMRSELSDEVQYSLPLNDNLEKGELIPMNQFVGKDISLRFEHVINCVVTGKKIKKAYGEGMSYDAFMSSPMASPSIIRPELSRIHEGIALRDEEWERKHHLTPHVVYLSKTSGIKVGVTRETQIPTRWIDQGAVEAVLIAKTPYRGAAGMIEVALKDFIADKTNWQRMLKNELTEESILDKKEELIEEFPEEFEDFLEYDNTITHINYPVLSFPTKVKSLKFDKTPIIEKKLVGIKGQYLIFDDEMVLNMRSHAGYLVSLEV